MPASPMLRTLIAEDNTSLHTIFRNLLLPFSNVDVVKSGLDAYVAVSRSLEQQAPYDLIVLDYMMPGMDGVSATRYIRRAEAEHDHRSKIVMVSGLHDTRMFNVGEEDGCDAFLKKPLRISVFMKELENLGLVTEAEIVKAMKSSPTIDTEEISP